MSVELQAIGQDGKLIELWDSPEEAFASAEYVNWCNARARAILAVLGLMALNAESLCGDAPIADWRRGLMAARARDLSASGWEGEIEVAPPHDRGDGVVVIGRPRVIRGGFYPEQIQRALDQAEAFVTLAASKGATHVGWT